MAVTNQFNRQPVLSAVSALTVANIGTGNEVTFAIPRGALLLGATVFTETAFNGTTNTLSLGDGTTVFANDVDVKSTGSETVANAPKFYANGGTITASMAQTGTASAGLAIVELRYVQLGAGCKVQE